MKTAIPPLNFQKLIENSYDGIALMDSILNYFTEATQQGV
jgi:hypothetical protein